MKKIQAIRLKMQALSSVDIMAMIPGDVLTRIKAVDEHPFFQAYSICHEGIANPTILGDTAKPVHWFKRAVQSIKNKIVKGINFFIGHNEDSSTEGRESVGEVIADTQKEINGKLHHIVIGYFPDKSKVQEMDVCSQEANWNLLEYAGHFVADTLDKITGIALANSEQEAPAFENAKRLASVQALEYNEEAGKAKDTGKVLKETRMDITTIPFNELVQEVHRRNSFPSQIFKIEDIKKDKEFNSVYTELEALKKTVEDKDSKINTLEEEKTGLSQELMTSTAKPRLDKILNNPDKPLTDEQRNFISKSFEKIDIDDVTDEGLQKFADRKLTDFQILEEIKSGKTETATVKTEKQNVDETDFTKSDNNELLSEDFEEV